MVPAAYAGVGRTAAAAITGVAGGCGGVETVGDHARPGGAPTAAFGRERTAADQEGGDIAIGADFALLASTVS